MNRKRILGFIYLLLGALLLASTSVLIRYIGKELTVYQQVYLRNGIALIMSVIAVLLTGQKFKSLKNLPKKYAPLALAFPLSVITFTFSVQYTKVATSIFTLYSASLLGSLVLGRIFYGERLKGNKLIAFILTFIGLGVYVWSLNVSYLGLGFVLGLLSGVLDSFANLYRKYVGGKVDRFVVTALNMVIGGGISFFLSVLAGDNLSNVSSVGLHVAALLFIFGAVITFMFYFVVKGFEYFDLNIGTIVLSSELIFGTIFALILFNEHPKLTELIGVIIIFMAQYALVKTKE
jgi:drug/metabolite transporter (DMT)-like permease